MSVNGGVYYGPDAPFGGYKQSGIGREMGAAGLDEFLERKTFAEPAPVSGPQPEQQKRSTTCACSTPSGTTASGQWWSVAASGMGAAVAELVQDAGAEVVVMDFADMSLPGAKAIQVNLADKASIDAAVDECGGPVHALFSCAGVADGTPGIERINFIGHRHLIDRMLAGGMLGRGARDRVHLVGRRPRLGVEPRAAERVPRHHRLRRRRRRGSQEHGKADYMSSKQAVCAYVARQAMPFLQQGIRINAICPGPTDTPAGPGEQGDLARLRRRLPRGGRDRGVDAAGAGVPARVPLQRRGRRDHRHDDDHRQRLLRRRHERVVPGRRRPS